MPIQGLGLGATVSFRWFDGDTYRGEVVAIGERTAELLLESGRTTQVELSELTLLALPKAIAPERERIIERQVIVMHCKYCQNLTPVDLVACRECGARM